VFVDSNTVSIFASVEEFLLALVADVVIGPKEMK
jgi:hypothetical protein